MFYFWITEDEMIKGIKIVSDEISTLQGFSFKDTSIYIFGSLDLTPFQGFIHKNFFSLNESISGIDFEFTNSTVDMVVDDGS